MRKAITAISRVSINGRDFFRLTYPTPQGRKREHFTDEKRAKTRLKEIQADAKEHGTRAADMSSALRADAVAAAAELEGTGRTLLDAARFLRDHIRRTESGVSIREAIDAFMLSRDESSAEYLNTLRGRMTYVANFFEGRTTASITPDDCQRLLDGLKGSAQTKKHYRVHLSVFFRYCKGRKWCADNPAEATSEIKVVSREAEILSPNEAAKLLAACSPEILPGVVLGMFCGLRQAEVERIRWDAVDLAQGIVTVGAGIAKTNSRRVVTIPDCAKGWLGPYAQRTGKVWPEAEGRARGLWDMARLQAGFGPFEGTLAGVASDAQQEGADLRPWPPNALRHSALSYRLAIERDLAKLAYEAGNSPSVIQRHYNGLARPAAAAHFFAIIPTEEENVSAFSTKAA